MNPEAPGFPEGSRPQATPGPAFPPEADSRGIDSDDPSTKAVASYIAGKYQTELRRVLALLLDVVFIHMAAAILSFPFLMLSLDSKLTLAPIYIVLATWRYGKTLGKRISGLEVRPWPDVIPGLPSPARISLAASMVREFVPILLALASMILWRMPGDNGRGLPFAFGLGFVVSTGTTFWILLEIVTMLTDPERRAFQDKVAGTVVVRTFTAMR